MNKTKAFFKSDKLPKFIATHNPMIGNKTIYIIHTQSPAFIAEASPANISDLLMQPKFTIWQGKKISIGAQTTVNGSLWLISVIRFFEDPFQHIDFDAQGSGGLMSRMGDWFHSYIKDFIK